MSTPRYLGLDWGEKRIGVAVSDPLGLTAQGLAVLEYRSPEQAVEQLRVYVRSYRPTALVIGLPRNMNGTLGTQAHKAQEMARLLEERLGVPITFWDERLSTQSAERTLLEADVSRSRRRSVRDKMAAVHILQGYLDSRGGT